MPDPGVGNDTVLELAANLGLYTVAEARRMLDDISEPQKYSLEDIELAHDSTLELFEDYCQVRFISATDTGLRCPGLGTTTLFLPKRRVTAVANVQIDELDGDGFAAYTGTILAVEDSWIVGDETFPTGSVVKLDVTNGWTAVPSNIKRAALVHLKDQILGTGTLAQTAIPARARAFTDGNLTVELNSTSGDRPTGIPYVDSVLFRRREHVLDVEGVSA